MHPLLRKKTVNQFDRREIRLLLENGPWCWPEDTSPDLVRRLEDKHNIKIPVLQPGEVLLIAVKSTDTSLWAMKSARRGDGTEPLTPLGTVAKETWNTAAIVIPRALPVLWRSIRQVSRNTPAAALLVRKAEPGQAAVDDGAIDGESFGLSMVLGLASMVMGIPVPETIAVSAAIGDRGDVLPVEALPRKVEMVASFAPRVRRFFVASRQVEEATHAARGAFEIVGLNSVAEAIEQVFPDLVERLIGAGNVERERNEILDALFRLAIEDRSAAIRWKPIREAAQHALERWPDLTGDERYTLEIVRAIAARHDGKNTCLPMPPSSWLAQHPSPIRLKVLAHLTQQSASFGQPSREEIAPLVEGALLRGLDAHDGHLRLLGAYGRLLTVRGQPRQAMETQREATIEWVKRFAFDQVSMPLCEWMRLAGALRDAGAASEALTVCEKLTTQREIGTEGLAYLELSKARLYVMMDECEKALLILPDVSRRTDVPNHVVLSVFRWWSRALRLSNASEAATKVVRDLKSIVRRTGESSEIPRLFLALTELDEALEDHDRDAAEGAVQKIRHALPGVVTQLCETAPIPDEDQTAKLKYIRDFFPY